jgi:hypothetical protein
MEMMKEHIKYRIEAFCDLLPCRKPKFDHVKNWFKFFRFFYNCVLTERKIGSALSSKCNFHVGLSKFLLIA